MTIPNTISAAYVLPGLKPVGEVKIDIGPLSPEFIKARVCKYFHIDVSVLSRKTRKQEVVRARHIAMYLMSLYTRLSLGSIAATFGDAITNHTTVIHGRETVRDQLSSRFDNDFKTDVPKIIDTLCR